MSSLPLTDLPGDTIADAKRRRLAAPWPRDRRGARAPHVPNTERYTEMVSVVEFYARRPQAQERMTEQIMEFLDRRLCPAGVMVIVQARHFCIEMRGMNRAGLVTAASAVRGGFADERRRREFLTLLPRSANATLEHRSDA